MRIRKYMPVIVSGSIAVILLVIGAIFLFRFYGQYQDVKQDLSSAESNIERLIQRDPFPSGENIEMERENLDKLQNQFSEIKAWLESGQIDIHEWRNPTEFKIKLDPRLQELRTIADDLNVDLPADLSFGFKKYAEGEMPAAGNVPRLARQLQMISAICKILFADSIEALDEVDRDEFDARGGTASDRPAASGRGRRGGFERTGQEEEEDESLKEGRDEQGLYAWEDFTLKFMARERAFWDVLGDLSNTNMLVSVRDLEVVSVDEDLEKIKGGVDIPNRSSREPRAAGRREAPDRRAGGFDAAGRPSDRGMPEQVEGEEKESPPREERVVAGEGMLDVSMKVRMYRLLAQKEESDNEPETQE